MNVSRNFISKAVYPLAKAKLPARNIGTRAEIFKDMAKQLQGVKDDIDANKPLKEPFKRLDSVIYRLNTMIELENNLEISHKRYVEPYQKINKERK